MATSSGLDPQTEQRLAQEKGEVDITDMTGRVGPEDQAPGPVVAAWLKLLMPHKDVRDGRSPAARDSVSDG